MFCLSGKAQSLIDSFRFRTDVKITIDRPASFHKNQKTQIIFFALPNGNTTAQTMGKLLQPNDDWHYDIQHIKAQTAFIRERSKENIIVVYLENDLRAWPQWKRNHANAKEQIRSIVDTTIQILQIKKYSIHLNSHSGGGAFIFGYLDAVNEIPSIINRITFIDSDYGYDSSYANKIAKWLNANKQHHLSVFAYNDSVALYNGKPIVSATGGTWYRSKLMMSDLKRLNFSCKEDTIIHCYSENRKANFFLKQNAERKIFHTQQVELNGFIHSVFIGTSNENMGYQYFGARAYANLIR